MTTFAPDTPSVSSQPVLMSEPQWDEAAWLEDTGQQMTTCEPDTHCVSSQPVLMSEPKLDEAAWLEDTGHQKRKLLEARRGIKSQQNTSRRWSIFYSLCCEPCSSKGKAPLKRTPWQPAEIKAVERHIKALIHACTVPTKTDWERCLRAEPEALKYREWQNVKSFVYNRIAANKRKMFLK
ncbi:unnamed protein product [Arctogadus glacialis]